MTNLTAVKSLCNAIANTFYPDDAAVSVALFNEGIDPQAQATPKDKETLMVAVRLCMGYVEGSRSEGGVSASVRSGDAVKQSIRIWCGHYGLDYEEVMADSLTVIDDVSDLW